MSTNNNLKTDPVTDDGSSLEIEQDLPANIEVVRGDKIEGDKIGGDKIGGDKISGDKIGLGNVSGRSVIAQGRGAQAKLTNIFNIDVRLLPLVFGLLGVVTVLAYFLLKPSGKPDVMDSEFNVAIAEFLVLDENGSKQKSEDGLNFSDWLYGRLSKNFEDVFAQLTGTYSIWPPEYTGVITGNTPQEREENAKKLAQEINADVVVYGVIQSNKENLQDSEILFEFYVNEKGFEEGQEIVGQYNLGSPMLLDLPFEKNELQDVENPGLSARARALSLLTVGLSYYAIDNFEDAIHYFSEAESTRGWFNSQGKEVVQMLLGNAYSRWSSKEHSQDYINLSREHYLTALDINTEYARAQIGLAGTIYLEALGDPENPSFKDVDTTLLDEAEQAFQKALMMGSPPITANIESKVHFSLGQIYLVRYVLEEGEWLNRARIEFGTVISELENGNEGIEGLAAHSYAHLGRIDIIEGDATRAIAHYELAVEHASPFYQTQYQSMIGDIYGITCQIDLSQNAYQRAFKKAVQYGDEDSAQIIEEKIRTLIDSDC